MVARKELIVGENCVKDGLRPTWPVELRAYAKGLCHVSGLRNECLGRSIAKQRTQKIRRNLS
jgi:hypothetical protein